MEGRWERGGRAGRFGWYLDGDDGFISASLTAKKDIVGRVSFVEPTVLDACRKQPTFIACGHAGSSVKGDVLEESLHYNIHIASVFSRSHTS